MWGFGCEFWDDRARAFFDRGRVNPVAETLLNNDGVAEITFGLREQVAYGHRLARARHAEQNRVLWRLVVSRAGERLDADQIVVRAIIDGFRGGKMTGEGAGHRQHVGQVTVFGIELAIFVTAPCPARPGLEKQVLRCARQIALEILRRVHRIDRVLDGAGLGVETILALVPHANDE